MTSQALLNAQAALHAARQRSGVVYTPPMPPPQPSPKGRGSECARANVAAQLAASMQVMPTPQPIEEPASRVMVRETINHHPDIGIAAMRANESSAYQLWMLLRFMDAHGRGWVDQDWAFTHLTERGSKWRQYERPRLRQVLAEGNGRYWSISPSSHSHASPHPSPPPKGEGARIWLRKTVHVAGELGIERLNGRFVYASIDDVHGAIAPFRATIFSAWLSNHRNPMSRGTIEYLTGLSARTQQRYNELAGIETVENLALGQRLTDETKQEAFWHHDGVFKFVDHDGRQGPPHRKYVAWHLPSSYTSTAQTAGRSQTRHANKQLAVLVKQTGAPGNGKLCAREQITRRFHVNGKRAALAQRNAQPGNDEMYWQLAKARTGRGLWQQMGSTQ